MASLGFLVTARLLCVSKLLHLHDQYLTRAVCERISDMTL